MGLLENLQNVKVMSSVSEIKIAQKLPSDTPYVSGNTARVYRLQRDYFGHTTMSQALLVLLFVSLICSTEAWGITKTGNFKRQLGAAVAGFGLALGPMVMPSVESVNARPEGVNRPELLPKVKDVPLIDTGNFLAKGQEKKIVEKLEALQKRTGIKLRVLCQAYPETPGLAIKDYWNLDDNSVVVVVDRGEGFNRKGIPTNIINLNIGKNVEGLLSNQFWNRVTNKLGNQPYVKAVGADTAVLNTVEALTFCLEDTTCLDLPFDVPSY